MFKRFVLTGLWLSLMFCTACIAGNTKLATPTAPPNSPNLEDVAIPGAPKDIEMISSLVHEDGYTWIEYKNEPYLNYGVQLRPDDIFTESLEGPVDPVLESYFEKAKGLGFRTVIVSLPWRYVEFEKDVYDFELYLDKVIAYAEKYDLTLQLMWFGSNVCGWPTLAPDYVLNDKERYARVAGPHKEWASFNFYDGDLLYRELLALYYTMEHIAEIDTDQRVMMMQIENEPDNVSQFLKNWGEGWEEHLWVGGQKEPIAYFLDRLGGVVHASSHPVLTRFNAFGADANAEDILNLDGIDMVGRNLYVYAPGDETVEGSFLNLSGTYDYPGNANHTPENGGQYAQNINLILSAFSKGQGYLIYELRTTGYQEYDFGIYRKTETDINAWIERDGTQKVQYDFDLSGDFALEGSTQELRAFNRLIYKVHKKIATLPPENKVDFNRENHAGTVDETRQVGNLTVLFHSEIGGEGFAMQDFNGDFYLLATKDQTHFQILDLTENATATAGYFDDDNNWIVERELTLDENIRFELNAFEAVRIVK